MGAFAAAGGKEGGNCRDELVGLGGPGREAVFRDKPVSPGDKGFGR